MNKTVLLILFVITSIQCSNSSAQTIITRSCAKVMSYNILHTAFEPATNPWTIRKQFLFELLESVSPDIVGFQEDSLVQRDDIAAQFPEYGVVDSQPDDYVVATYRSIFYKKSRYSLVDSGDFPIPNSVGRRGTWAKLMETRTGATYFLTNSHFLTGAAHENLPERRLDAAITMATQTATLNTENSPIIMLGDLNELPTGQPVLYLTSDINTYPSLYYHPNFRKLYITDEYLLDDDLYPEGSTTSFTIDYILTSDDLDFYGATKSQRSGIVNSNTYLASDHYAATQTICYGSASFLPPIIYYILDD